jgi:hypothetical protein
MTRSKAEVWKGDGMLRSRRQFKASDVHMGISISRGVGEAVKFAVSDVERDGRRLMSGFKKMMLALPGQAS